MSLESANDPTTEQKSPAGFMKDTDQFNQAMLDVYIKLNHVLIYRHDLASIVSGDKGREELDKLFVLRDGILESMDKEIKKLKEFQVEMVEMGMQWDGNIEQDSFAEYIKGEEGLFVDRAGRFLDPILVKFLKLENGIRQVCELALTAEGEMGGEERRKVVLLRERVLEMMEAQVKRVRELMGKMEMAGKESEGLGFLTHIRGEDGGRREIKVAAV